MASLRSDKRRGCMASLGMVLLVLCPLPAGIFWIDDRPTALTWGLRIGLTVLSVVGIVLVWVGQNRKDELPDHLAQRVDGLYFIADGFAFFPEMSKRRGVAYIDLYFQNQRDCHCVGRAVLLPQSALDGGEQRPIAFEIPCPPGAFGVAQIPLAIARQFQGRREFFRVGGACEFPQGKGGFLRHKPALEVPELTGGEEFTEALMTVASLLTFLPSLGKGPKVLMRLPEDVAEVLPPGLEPESKILEVAG